MYSLADITEWFLTAYVVNTVTGCWEWQKAFVKNRKGQPTYGHISHTTRAHIVYGEHLAHRLSYRMFKGLIPKKLFVCHTCDNPKCVNPEHLFIATHKENMEDMVRKGRQVRIQGSQRWNSKLTEKQVHHIKKLLSKGVGTRKIAREYGVHHSVIDGIKHGRKWAHVT